MTAETEREMQRLAKRFAELAETCDQRSVYCFTGFLGMAQIDCFYRAQAAFSHVPYTLFGGNDGCERQMVRFGSAGTLGYEEPFPIVCLEIRPRAEKFAEALSHRDVLGACMSLGVDRSVTGDIQALGARAYLYCTESIAPYLTERLTKIRHTDVSCARYDGRLAAIAPRLEAKEYQLASERLDAVLAKAYGLSREKSRGLFDDGRVFVNGRASIRCSDAPKAGDVISVRGYGRLRYGGVTRKTKKDKYNIMVEFYV